MRTRASSATRSRCAKLLQAAGWRATFSYRCSIMALWNALCIDAIPANLSSAWLEQPLDLGNFPTSSQECESAHRRIRERLAQACGCGEQGSAPGDHIIDEHHTCDSGTGRLHAKGIVVRRDAGPGTPPRRSGLAHRSNTMQAGP